MHNTVVSVCVLRSTLKHSASGGGETVMLLSIQRVINDDLQRFGIYTYVDANSRLSHHLR